MLFILDQAMLMREGGVENGEVTRNGAYELGCSILGAQSEAPWGDLYFERTQQAFCGNPVQ